MIEGQPGYVIKMVAKPGNGDTLRKLATDGMRIANEGGTWVHCNVEKWNLTLCGHSNSLRRRRSESPI